MTLKQSNYKVITALLLILVIAVGAVWAPLYVEASTGHDCSGTACPVCLTVSFACQSGKVDADQAESAS